MTSKQNHTPLSKFDSAGAEPQMNKVVLRKTSAAANNFLQLTRHSSLQTPMSMTKRSLTSTDEIQKAKIEARINQNCKYLL